MARFLRNGVVAGAAAGAALALVLLTLGEDVIGRAVAREAASAHDHREVFTRSVQTAGGVLGSLLYGTALGVVYATVFAAVRHRLGLANEFRRAVLVAGAGWAGAVLVPFVLAPPNPPGIGSSDTVGDRTAQYLVAVLWGLVTVYAVARTARHLRRSQRPEPAVWGAAFAVFVGLVALGALLLPDAVSANEVPADLVWSFRVRSLAGTSACWAVLGLTFGALADRAPLRRSVDV